MSNSQLPERASLEYLKKLAKDRLQDLRRADPQAKLATALLAVARDHGFSSWRALKAEVEQSAGKRPRPRSNQQPGFAIPWLDGTARSRQARAKGRRTIADRARRRP